VVSDALGAVPFPGRAAGEAVADVVFHGCGFGVGGVDAVFERGVLKAGSVLLESRREIYGTYAIGPLYVSQRRKLWRIALAALRRIVRRVVHNANLEALPNLVGIATGARREASSNDSIDALGDLISNYDVALIQPGNFDLAVIFFAVVPG
jgi:hypothetical protein